MKLILVVAYGKNREIGKSGDLPGWRLPDDMREFSELTKGGFVIMGRKTFESFPPKYRPLPNRNNLIISRNLTYVPEPTNFQTHVMPSLKYLILGLNQVTTLNIYNLKTFIIGGGEIYKEIIKWFDDKRFNFEIIATEVNGEFPEADTFFPKIDLSGWKKDLIMGYKKGPIEPGSKKENSHDFEIVRYYR